jgi:hypothetical protein
MEKVFLVQNTALMITSSYYETIGVFDTIEKAEALIENMKNEIISAIETGHHETFNVGDYSLTFDDNVPLDYSKADKQMCFLDNDGYYDIYWIEEWIVK